MGKLLDRLNKQLMSENKKDAEDCLKIYNYLKDEIGHVWESEWRVLVSTKLKGFASDEKIFKPTPIGYTLIKGIENPKN